MTALLTGVKSRLFLRTRLAATHPLDGAHASLQRARSLDFEDLRDYEVGDDVRNIDWKATARHGDLLVKRSRATRMHPLQLAVETGRGMAAIAPDDHPKRSLAIQAVGTLGLLGIRAGDEVSVLLADSGGAMRLPGTRSEGGLEHALRTIDRASTPAAPPSSRSALVDAVRRTVTGRRILVVVTDEAPITDQDERMIRRLAAQHDLLWLTVRDADPASPQKTRRARLDVTTGWQVPDYLAGDADVVREIREERARGDHRRTTLLDSLSIDHAELSAEASVVPSLLGMLRRRSRVHR